MVISLPFVKCILRKFCRKKAVLFRQSKRSNKKTECARWKHLYSTGLPGSDFLGGTRGLLSVIVLLQTLIFLVSVRHHMYVCFSLSEGVCIKIREYLKSSAIPVFFSFCCTDTRLRPDQWKTFSINEKHYLRFTRRTIKTIW